MNDLHCIFYRSFYLNFDVTNLEFFKKLISKLIISNIQPIDFFR